MTEIEPKAIRSIDDLNMDKEFVKKLRGFLEFMESIGKPMAAHETFRTQERQDYLIGKGSSRITRSNHQDGLAADLHFVNFPHFPADSDSWRFAALEAKKFGIDCGGLLWNGFDWNHFQDDGSPSRETIIDWRENARSKAMADGYTNGERPSENLTRVELWETLRKFKEAFGIK